MLTFITIDLQP